jgi:uncharacterized protein YdeI (YjbR/CyaY-like superfamily)
MKPAREIPIAQFEHQKAWDAWLIDNHHTSPGVWLQLAKKASGVKSVTYDEAVEAALCHGWIDGQKKALDAAAWLQKFTPRGAKSLWSKINRDRAEGLIASGRMRPAGLAAVESARKDGRWAAAYDSPSGATVPPDFQAALDRNKKAKAFYAKLESRNTYAILWRIQTAKKAETRARRIQEFIAMLERHEKLYP